MKTGVRIAGAGGHGLVTAAIVLADGATRAGLNVCQTQSYGPEARGGGAHADILISDAKIAHPKIVRADILVALTQEACSTFAKSLKESGVLIIDAEVVRPRAAGRTISLPLLASAREHFGGETYCGVMATGAVSALVEALTPSLLEEAIAARLPKPTVAANLRAFNLGRELCAKALAAPAAESYEADL